MSTFSIILTISLGLAAILSPIVVSVINNRYALVIRKAEFEHDEELKRIACEQLISEKRLDVEFKIKMDAFSELIECASNHYYQQDGTALTKLYSAAYKATSVCTYKRCRDSIIRLVEYAKKNFVFEDGSGSKSDVFSYILSDLSIELTKELFPDDSSNNK